MEVIVFGGNKDKGGKEPPKVLDVGDGDELIGDDDQFVVVDLTNGVVVLRTGDHGEAFAMMRAYAAKHACDCVATRIVGRFQE